MNATKGIVFNIQNFSVHDGNGIRTLVFLKGCPLRCFWCSNPESQLRQPEMGFNPDRCLGTDKCTRCIRKCPNDAISQTDDNLIMMNPDKCQHCFTCADNCAAGALNVYGKEMTVDEVIEEVEKESLFYARSGGGMTLSGGEATAQPEFGIALLKEARRRRIHTAMESCACVKWEVFREFCANLDQLMVDLKAFDEDLHKKGTGVGNQLIKENILRAIEEFPNLPILVRTPVIPGFNDNAEELRKIIGFLPVRPNVRYEMLPYHRMGQPKYAYLGREFPMGKAEISEEFMRSVKPMEIMANERFGKAK